MGEQFAGMPSVFAGDQVHLAQNSERPQSNVLEIAYRGGNEVKRPRHDEILAPSKSPGQSHLTLRQQYPYQPVRPMPHYNSGPEEGLVSALPVAISARSSNGETLIKS